MRSLLLVDVQNDFMPFGALPVRDGDAVVGVANRLVQHFGLVVASQDWHPPDHSSFASNHAGKEPGDVVTIQGADQVLWPDHCVQNTPGASFHSGLHIEGVSAVVRKGIDREIDSYSAFFDNGRRRDTGLADLLRGQAVDEIWVAGLATDYCVLWTALDALDLGFRCVIVEDGVRAVDLKPGDGERVLGELARSGCSIARSGDAALGLA